MIGNREQAILYIMSLPENTKIEVSEYKPKRTSQQNAYYWKLCTQIANVMRISKTAEHNDLLRHYGQPLLIDGAKAYVFIPDTDDAERAALNSETFHIKRTSSVKEGNDGVTYRGYYHLLGSSKYNSYEMSVLLDGCIQEAKNLGINTLTPDEIARMRQEDEAIERRRRAKRHTA